MKKGTLRKSFEFLLVFLVVIVAIFLLEFFKSSQVRTGIIFSVSSFYIIAGIIYHYEQKNLKLSQIFEYAAVGVMMFAVLSAVYH